MEADRMHDVVTTSSDRVVGDGSERGSGMVLGTGTLPPPTMRAPVPPTTYVPAAEVNVDEVVSTRRVSLPAVLAGALGVAMIVWGALVLARAGLDGPFREPVVTVAGLDANALAGAITGGLGLLLLISALTADRAAILFAAIVSGIAALVAVFEPGLGHGALDIERELPAIIAIGAAVVVLAVLLVPNMQRRVHRVDRSVD